ncbi:MAG TPA: hypothetical protein VFQ75_07735 [Candidatus Limnocylindrales bacterium]|nr:hypothetical protein [Candidatus Limnocylindrales bacterium]
MTTPAPGPRADAIPRSPTIGGALRAGASDLFYNSWRVVPANLLLGAGLVLVLWTWATFGAVATAVIAAPLAAPLAGLFRLGAMATRGRDVNLSDVADPVRAEPVAILVTGAAFALATLVLVTNLATGLLLGGVVAWAIATAAGWGIVLVVMLGFALWPLAVDPVRAGTPWMARVRLAGLLVLAHPGRIGGLALVLSVILVASTVVVVALLTVSVGLVALVACRYVLPAADRLEAVLGQRAEAGVDAGKIRA